jgi:hypothetical protein
MAAVTFFENNQHQFIPETIRENALRFSEKTFNQKFVAQVKTVLYENKLGQASQ